MRNGSNRSKEERVRHLLRPYHYYHRNKYRDKYAQNYDWIRFGIAMFTKFKKPTTSSDEISCVKKIFVATVLRFVLRYKCIIR